MDVQHESDQRGIQQPARSAAGDWHTGPRRQFVITLSGRAELEVANGQKVRLNQGTSI